MKRHCWKRLERNRHDITRLIGSINFTHSGYLSALVLCLWIVSCVSIESEYYHESIQVNQGYWYGLVVSSKNIQRIYDEPTARQVNEIFYFIQDADEGSMRLNIPSTPQTYAKTCDSVSKSWLQCLYEIAFWGVLLHELDDEKSRLKDLQSLPLNDSREISRQFLEYALNALRQRLEEYKPGSKSWAEEYSRHAAIFDRSHFRDYTDTFPKTVQTIYQNITIDAWRNLPKNSVPDWLFYENVYLAEALKDNVYYIEPLRPEYGSVEHIQSAIEFYLTAFQFHRLPGPAPRPGQPNYIEATIGEGFTIRGTGYSLRPNRQGLWPVKDLPLFDLDRLEMLTTALRERGVISEVEEKEKIEAYTKQRIEIEIEDITYWINLSKVERDSYSLATNLVERSSYRFDQGEFAATEKDLQAALKIFLQIGATREWAITSVKLATLYYMQKDYELALATIEPAFGSIESTWGFGKFHRLKEALVIKEVSLWKLDKEIKLQKFQDFYKQKIDRIISTSEKVDVELEAVERIPILATREERLRKLLAKYQSQPLLRLVISAKLLKSLKAQARLEEAAELAQQIRPIMKKLVGATKEIEILGSLLEIQYERGEYASFLSALSEYELLARELYGNNWMKPFETLLARVYYSIEEYQKAIYALEKKQERHLKELIQYPDNTESDPDLRDQLLSARIQFALGNKKQSMEIVNRISRKGKYWALERAIIQNKFKEIGIDVLQEVGEMYVALGEPDRALEFFEQIVDSRKPEEDLDVWVKAAVNAELLRIESGNPPRLESSRLTRMINSIKQFPEFNRLNAVYLGEVLSARYQAAGDYHAAKYHLTQALELAEELGAIEEKIKLYRQLGDQWSLQGNLDEAEDNYRKSVLLLGSVSERIPSDTSKVGYREERARAIPLLVATNYKQYKETKEAAYIESALWAIEQGKNRSLVEVLAKKHRTPNATVTKLRKALASNEELLIYYVGSEGELYRIYLTDQDLELAMLDQREKQVDDQLLQLRQSIISDQRIDASSFTNDAQRLARVLLPSMLLTNKAQNQRIIYIVPSGALNLVPVELLKDEHGRYLGERADLAFSYLPSATLLLRVQSEKTHRFKTAAYINPSLERQHHEILIEKPEFSTKLDGVLRKLGSKKIIWEKRRTPAQFLDEINQAQGVFIYAHARFLPDRPMESYVRLASDSGSDGKLTASDIATQQLSNEAWVIAGCSTGQGRVRTSSEVLGLPRALLLAGVKSVVISLWDVDAVSSFEMMIKYYENLAKGKSPAQALNVARIAMKEAGSGLYDWAPFVVVGFR